MFGRYSPGERPSTDRSSVSLGYGGHRWQRVGSQRQRVEDAVMNAHGFVFLEHAVGAELGQPDVENLLALCLTGRRTERKRNRKQNFVDQ